MQVWLVIMLGILATALIYCWAYAAGLTGYAPVADEAEDRKET